MSRKKHHPRAPRPHGSFRILARVSDWASRLHLVAELGPLGQSVLIAAPIVAAALFYVWTHVTTVQLGYALSRAGEVHERLLEENRGLRIENAALRAPDRLKKLARVRFHQKSPQATQVIRFEGANP